MKSSERVPRNSEREIDLVTLWWIIWDHKYLVTITTFVCAVIAVILALIATPIYRATVVVTQARDNAMSAESPLGGGQIGGLASLAGLNLGANGPNVEREAVLHSRRLVDKFVEKYNVLPLLFGKSKKPMSAWLAVEVFRKDVLTIEEDKLKGTNTVSIDWTDPTTAALWANGFVQLANDLLRARAIQDSSRNIDYLNKRIADTNQIEVQRVMYNLIEAETKTLMLANGRIEYAFTNVDPAVIPEVRVSPKRTLMVLSGILIGLVLGSMIAWIRVRFARPVHNP